VAAQATAQRAAQGLGLRAQDVFVCSTGLIGEHLPMDRLLPGVDAAVEALADGPEAGLAAATAIMTTDTRPKTTVVQASDGAFTIGGMAKGAGMLAPELATMLVVMTSDAMILPRDAQRALKAATAATFDRVDSDGCMSTNDTVLLLTSGESAVVPDVEEFTALLTEACRDLALQLLADAEGSEHDITITVTGASSQEAALAVARAIARSNLVKAAIYGRDANWGRILSAAGTVPAEVAPFDPDAVDLAVNGVSLIRAAALDQPRSLVDLTAREVTITLDLHAGGASGTIWTNDLTHAYVEENSAYST
jgi:glutamate N-acetyltransferase/amino-acid N-acetyltransferase